MHMKWKKSGILQQTTPTHCLFQIIYAALIQSFFLLHVREYTLAYSLIPELCKGFNFTMKRASVHQQ